MAPELVVGGILVAAAFVLAATRFAIRATSRPGASQPDGERRESRAGDRSRGSAQPAPTAPTATVFRMHSESELSWRIRRLAVSGQTGPDADPAGLPRVHRPREATVRRVTPEMQRTRTRVTPAPRPSGSTGAGRFAWPLPRRLTATLAALWVVSIGTLIAIKPALEGGVLPTTGRPSGEISAISATPTPFPTVRRSPAVSSPSLEPASSPAGSRPDAGAGPPGTTVPVSVPGSRQTRPTFNSRTPSPTRAPARPRAPTAPPSAGTTTPGPAPGAPSSSLAPSSTASPRPTTSPTSAPAPASPRPGASTAPSATPTAPPATLTAPPATPTAAPPTPSPTPSPGTGAPIVEFSVSVDGLVVRFTNRTRRADTWTWSFGDGATSTARNPSHAYASPGTYTVTLTAVGESGAAASRSQSVIVGG